MLYREGGLPNRLSPCLCVSVVCSMFETLVGVVAVLAGAIASVSGFGIGSLLTPVFTLRMDL